MCIYIYIYIYILNADFGLAECSMRVLLVIKEEAVTS